MDHSCSSSSVLDSGGLEVLGSTKQSRDPPAQCHGVQTDPPVPALRFCGQLAQWTGNSTNYQVRAAHATLVDLPKGSRFCHPPRKNGLKDASPGSHPQLSPGSRVAGWRLADAR
ncbi:hypothetical protein D4764_06G0011560 [Takifugu flavidus]|uniref:Uncharacterized protein n=1 Tax=Takifugu flavidus TaxID=433684 RepID=A0A5C6MX13_9TELE|nr:hypothetical protein D4764_06G0011560 [Takifugu flavidus]